MKKSYLSLFACVFLTLAAGMISGAANRPDAWYAALVKPLWTPPGWIFVPVWIVLYVLMGVALWLIWERRSARLSSMAITLFMIQLILNVAWSWFFFGLHSPALAFADICLLWAAILATILLFASVYRPAALLLVPYFLWVSFAAVLNFSIWRLNAVII